MKRTLLSRFRTVASVLATTALAASGSAWAQAQPPVGAITYVAGLAGPVQPVPTLAEWGVLVLSLLMALMAWRAARGRLACLVLAIAPGVLAAAMLVATSWSGPAEAAPAPDDVQLNNPSGGTADIPYHTSLDRAAADYMHQYQVRNTTGQSVRITGVSLTPGHNDRDPRDPPRCTVGTVLAADESCNLLVSKPR
ncbi:midcut-by-XrtH protein [Acidovorax sp. JMULE5]|uniref:midcut-by-XrtH protein n=1 Tax=Acidovorax sp. JMULE5 TaxID=2518343 RepID=UPI0015A12464|nr:midcut-by-XrtH protein [Acidovorax sp. JMULE5]QLA80672.1 midcut-by-XrtH protein [Acidovorax sp. JMULE5]